MTRIVLRHHRLRLADIDRQIDQLETERAQLLDDIATREEEIETETDERLGPIGSIEYALAHRTETDE